MSNVNAMQQVTKKPKLNNVSITDLTSKYQEKINNYNSMINTMDANQKNLFQTAINIYDIKKRQNSWDSYVAYALKTLAMFGYYYDVINQSWKTCSTPDSYVNPEPQQMDDDGAYRKYLRSLYPSESCALLGLSTWEILDAEVNPELIKKANGGEMAYEYYDLEFNLGGEQDATKTKKEIVIPNIPISPTIDVKEMTKGDKSNDKFIYAYTDSGISKNNRDWRPMIMDRIAQQVMDNCPPGNLGHVNPKNVGYELPLPVVTWIGATTELLPDGINKRLWLKGYVIPVEGGNQLKTFIKAKAINSISVYGGITLLPNEETGVQSVLDCELKSIDISGKLKEGLNSGIVKLAGEMHNPMSNTKTNNKEEANHMDLSKVTLAELKIQNPQLCGEMKADIIASLQTEEKQKVILTKAGEMDSLVSQYGDNLSEQLKSYNAFVGEMAEAVGIAPKEGTVLPKLSDVIDKVKENVAKVSAVTEVLKPAEGQDVVAKAQEMANEVQLSNNKKAIANVGAKFEDLTKGVQNDSIKELVKMQFNGILTATPESIGEGFEADSISKLEAEVPTAIEKVTAQAQSLIQTGQTAGEMAMFDNLGVGGRAGSNGKSVDDMTDEEYAKSLGYGM